MAALIEQIVEFDQKKGFDSWEFDAITIHDVILKVDIDDEFPAGTKLYLVQFDFINGYMTGFKTKKDHDNDDESFDKNLILSIEGQKRKRKK